MNHLKILGLLLILAALAGSAANASATVLTSPAGTVHTGQIQAASIGAVTMNGPLSMKTECTKSFGGTVVADGTSVTVAIQISNVTLSPCKNGYSVTVLGTGTMEFHSTGGGGGTVTITGLTLTKSTPLGFNCEYTANATQLGTFTSSKNTGGNAILDISASLPRTGHSAFCGSSGHLTGQMQFTSPIYLDID